MLQYSTLQHLFINRNVSFLTVSCDSLSGWLGSYPDLESQPVGDDPHVPLPYGPHLLHLVCDVDPLGRDKPPCGANPTTAVLHRPGSANRYHQSHLDAQEDHAAAQPRGLELWRQTGTGKRTCEGPGAGFCQSSLKLRGHWRGQCFVLMLIYWCCLLFDVC